MPANEGTNKNNAVNHNPMFFLFFMKRLLYGGNIPPCSSYSSKNGYHKKQRWMTKRLQAARFKKQLRRNGSGKAGSFNLLRRFIYIGI